MCRPRLFKKHAVKKMPEQQDVFRCFPLDSSAALSSPARAPAMPRQSEPRESSNKSGPAFLARQRVPLHRDAGACLRLPGDVLPRTPRSAIRRDQARCGMASRSGSFAATSGRACTLVALDQPAERILERRPHASRVVVAAPSACRPARALMEVSRCRPPPATCRAAPCLTAYTLE